MTNKTSPKRIGVIVSKIDRLKQLVDKAEQLERLNDLVLPCLPRDYVNMVRLSAVRDGCLVLQAENSAVATQLRYCTPEILEKVQKIQAFGEIRSIRIRKRQAQDSHTTSAQKSTISATAAANINATADEIDDNGLRGALRRLAARSKRDAT